MPHAPMAGWKRSSEDEPPVLRVAELNRVCRLSLEGQFPDVWVEGELSDVARPGPAAGTSTSR